MKMLVNLTLLLTFIVTGNVVWSAETIRRTTTSVESIPGFWFELKEIQTKDSRKFAEIFLSDLGFCKANGSGVFISTVSGKDCLADYPTININFYFQSPKDIHFEIIGNMGDWYGNHSLFASIDFEGIVKRDNESKITRLDANDKVEDFDLNGGWSSVKGHGTPKLSVIPGTLEGVSVALHGKVLLRDLTFRTKKMWGYP